MKPSLPRLAGWTALCLATNLLAADAPIDWDKAGKLHQRASRGEKLSPEDQAYYERALKARNAKGQPGGNPQAAQPKWTQHLTPLNELGTGKYKGEEGGLYGGGLNEPPKMHLEAALKEAAKIQPLDAEGKPSPDGKIVLLSMGMSNTTMEFSRFKQVADADPAKSGKLVIVDGAQGGRTASVWAREDADVWGVVADRLRAAGVTAAQIQVVWLKQAEGGPSRLGDFPAHAKALKDFVIADLNNAKKRFPNLRVAYLSSRIYGGYATTGLNPEPYAYEGAFAMRWVIQDQIKGDTRLNYDAARGEVKAPLVLWGPYLWGDGETPRKDGLVWKLEDLTTNDGTHPSNTARQKVADLLLKFVKTDPTAKLWFLKK
jgi:hypothetical protein